MHAMQEREAEKKQAELEAAKRSLDAKKAEEQQKERELSQIRDKIKGAELAWSTWLLPLAVMRKHCYSEWR